jgi:hypothetical protein
MSLRTSAQLAQDFPVSTTAQIIASAAKFDYLLRDGFVGAEDEISQILTAILGAIAPLAESYAAPTAAYTGAAGTVERFYYVVPTYPLPVAMGGATNPLGRYLNFIGGKSPHGEGAANARRVQDPGTARFYGLPSPSTAVNNTIAALDATDYVTITTPAAQNIPGVEFDIISSLVAGGPYTTVAADVAPGATYEDNGDTGSYESPYYGMTYSPRTLAEVGYDPSYNSGTVVYGPLSRK